MAVIVLGILSLKIISLSILKGTKTDPNNIPRKDNPSNRINSAIIFFEIVIFKNKAKCIVYEQKPDNLFIKQIRTVFSDFDINK